MKKPHAANTEQRQAADPAASAWVNANAGSGKTHVLVNRLIRLMLAGTPPARILCLTFTKAAAAEMSTRLFKRLSGWIALSDREVAEELAAIGVADIDAGLCVRARRLFTEALETPGGLKIQTIHAFCERLLQLFPVEAGIAPRFQVMDDIAATDMLQAARRTMMSDAAASPDGELGSALAEVVTHVQADRFDELLSVLIKKRADIAPYLDGATGLHRAASALRSELGLTAGDDEVAVRASVPLPADDYARAIAALETGSDGDRTRAIRLSDALAQGVSLFALQDIYFTKAPEPCALSSLIGNKSLRDSDTWLVAFMTGEQRRLQAALGKLADLANLRATLALLRLASAVLAAFEREKRRRGAYDFDDLIHYTHRLLAEKPDAQWVLFKLDGGIDHVLLDEAQDTSPAQWSILSALAEEFFAGLGRDRALRTLFVVGDRKQSIYSFQGADPDFFETVHEEFSAKINGAGLHLTDVDFKVSFRSAQEVLTAVDRVFADSQPARKGLLGRSEREILHQSNRRGVEGLVELWPLVEPEERDEPEPWQFPVDREPANSPRRKLARQIAQKVGSWIGRRRLTGSNRAVAPGDILILVRTRNSFFDALVRELRRAGVPVAGADRLHLAASLAVQDVLALARACLLEADDYSLACALKSPLLADPLTEDELFALAHDRGAATLSQRLRQSRQPRLQAVAESLDLWRQQAVALRPFEFLAGVIGGCRRRMAARLGSEANDALDALLDAVLAYEGDHPSSLQGFLSWFVAGDIEIKRNMEPGVGEVRIMTVHGAKGLEAPIVILPDTVSMPELGRELPLRFLENEGGGAALPLWQLPKSYVSEPVAAIKARLGDARLHEYRRLLYVAMTRAADELYIAGFAGSREAKPDCWYLAMSEALRPVMRDTGSDGIWRLGAEPEPLHAPAHPAAVEASALPGWLAPPGTPAVPPEPPRRRATKPLPDSVAGAPAIERGLLIHRALQLMPEVAVADRAATLRRLVARAGHPPSLAEELARLVARPDIAGLLGDDGLSEVPIRAPLADGSELSGRIDRLILAGDHILIVDYKTDRLIPAEPAQVAPAYLGQLAAYAGALRRIHAGAPVRAAILWTSAPSLMHIPDMVLEEALDHNPLWRP